MENENKPKKKIFSWRLISLVLLLLLIVSIFTNGFGLSQALKSESPEKVALEALTFINSNLLQPGSAATLVEASPNCEKGVGLCKFSLNVNGSVFDSYISSNGKILFPDAIDIEEYKATLAQMENSSSEPVEVPQTAKPEVELFVMSYCPFGLQSQKALVPVMELLEDKADIKIRFVDYIMHGEEEIDENLRQYCIQQEEPEKLVAYLNCFIEAGDYNGCLSTTGINQNKMNTCVQATDQAYKIKEKFVDKSTWLNERYPLFEAESDLNDKYGVQGSPTLVINGQVVSPARTPDSYKETICQAFNELPVECSQSLATETPSAGLGWETTEAPADASCE